MKESKKLLVIDKEKLIDIQAETVMEIVNEEPLRFLINDEICMAFNRLNKKLFCENKTKD